MENAEGWRGSKWLASSICSILPLLSRKALLLQVLLIGGQKGKCRHCPNPGVRKHSPFCRGTDAPPDLYFICARALKAQSQAAGNPTCRGLGKQRHTQTYIINEGAEQQEKIKGTKTSSTLLWQEMDTWGLLISGRKWMRIWEKHPLGKQNCKGRLAASVLEVFWKKQQSM